MTREQTELHGLAGYYTQEYPEPQYKICAEMHSVYGKASTPVLPRWDDDWPRDGQSSGRRGYQSKRFRTQVQSSHLFPGKCRWNAKICIAEPRIVEEEQVEEEVEEEVGEVEEVKSREPPNLNTIPYEIRLQIFKYVLVADRPFMVYKKWQRVYPRNKPAVTAGLLRVCSRFYVEAVPILYGENVFHYRIRDAPSIADITALAYDRGDKESADRRYGEPSYQSEHDEQDEHEANQQSRGRARRTRPLPGHAGNRDSSDIFIDVKKFRPYFRHIIVEAEHNRTSADAELVMAQAINVFHPERPVCLSSPFGEEQKVIAKPGRSRGRGRGRGKDRGGHRGRGDRIPNTSLPSPKANIHTLTIRISPIWAGTGESFSFIDFFARQSPVIEALQAIDCQFIRVDLITKHLYKRYNLAAPEAKREAPEKSCRLLVDMRHRKMVRGTSQEEYNARKHTVIWQYMMSKAKRSHQKLSDLQKHILDKCKIYVPESAMQDANLEGWELMAFWDELELGVEDWDEE